MKKRYGYTNRTAIKLSCLMGVLIFADGVYKTYSNNKIIGIAGIVIGILFFIYNAYFYSRLGNAMDEIMDIVADEEKEDYTTDVLQLFPLPMAIMHVDGNVIWYNSEFSDMIGKDSFAGHTISTLMPSLKWSYVLKAKGAVSMDLSYNERTYNVRGRIVRHEDSGSDNVTYLVYLFFVDKTNEAKFKRLYTEEKTDVTIISIDNYEYIIQKLDDSKSQNVLYKIAKELNEWIKISGGVLKKTDRDRYIALFEHKYLKGYIEDKFSVLEKIRAVGEEAQIPISISMGTGTGNTVTENEKNARNALEMAISRGGDQAAIKDDTQYKFFGAKNNEYEKSNRLKTRAVAKALTGFIEGVEKVIFVGHKSIDYDGFGAAMGLQRVVRTMDKKPYILVDSDTQIKNLYSQIIQNPDYEGMFVDCESVLDVIDRDTLLVILDTSRNSLLPSSHLLSRTEKVIVIDHHRRPTDYITPCSLIYNEPFASSTCEMVTELLQYINGGKGITSIEAQSLYMGILLDTKNFLLKTGVRTFEAASYLKRLGLDTVAVKKMFNIGKSEYMIKSEIVQSLEHITDTVTMGVCEEEYENIRAIASQAADEMLNVDNSQCSFVLYRCENSIGISGRSFGDINVQLILEQLGGGGHQTVAGAQIETPDMDYAIECLRRAVISYENDSKEAQKKEN